MEIFRDILVLIGVITLVVCLMALPFLLVYFSLWIITTFWVAILALVVLGIILSVLTESEVNFYKENNK